MQELFILWNFGGEFRGFPGNLGIVVAFFDDLWYCIKVIGQTHHLFEVIFHEKAVGLSVHPQIFISASLLACAAHDLWNLQPDFWKS